MNKRNVFAMVALLLVMPLLTLPATHEIFYTPRIVGIYDVGFTVQHLDVSRDGSYVIVSGTVYDTATLLHFTGGSVSLVWSTVYGGPVAISYMGRYVVIGSGSTLLFFLGVGGSGTPLWTATLDSEILDVAISATGSYIAVLTKNSIYLYNRWGRVRWRYVYYVGTNYGSTGNIKINFFGNYVAASTFASDGTTSGGIYVGNHTFYLFAWGGRMLWSYTINGLESGVGEVAMDIYGRLIAGTHATSTSTTLYVFHRDGLEYTDSFAGSILTEVDVSDNEYIVLGGLVTGDEHGTAILLTEDLETVGTLNIPGTSGFDVSINGNARYVLFQSGSAIYLYEGNSVVWGYFGAITASKITKLGTLAVFSEGGTVYWAMSKPAISIPA